MTPRHHLDPATLVSHAAGALSPEMAARMIEIKPEPRGSKSREQLLAAERSRIDAALPASVRLIVLDEKGDDLTTLKLAGRLEQWQADGRDAALLIGGADGLDDDGHRTLFPVVVMDRNGDTLTLFVHTQDDELARLRLSGDHGRFDLVQDHGGLQRFFSNDAIHTSRLLLF